MLDLLVVLRLKKNNLNISKMLAVPICCYKHRHCSDIPRNIDSCATYFTDNKKDFFLPENCV